MIGVENIDQAENKRGSRAPMGKFMGVSGHGQFWDAKL